MITGGRYCPPVIFILEVRIILYRIDFQHFLTHMIDYFPPEELIHFQYLVISAKISVEGKVGNCAKISMLYPDPELVAAYAESYDKTAFEKAYHDMLDKNATDGVEKRKVTWSESIIAKSIIMPILNHDDVVIICDRVENYIVDAMCSYLKKKFDIDVIDFNELFKTGHVGPYRIDRDALRDRSVDINRAAARDMYRSLESTREGRLKILAGMTKKDKLRKLKDIGINVTKADMGRLDELLVDGWVEDEQ